MEIKYINTFEDIEFLIKYIQYKMGFSKYKYSVCSISVISGIYYSIKLQNLIYFFTNTVIMTFIVFFWLKKTENKDINRISKKIAIKNCNKDRYFLSEKKLILDNRKIYIYCNNDKYEMKIDKFIKVNLLNEYILIFSTKSFGYKKKLIIPRNIFKNEEEINKFIEKITI